MKVILIAILISAGCSQAFFAAQNVPQSGTVEGIVVNSVTGAGIGGAYVGLSIDRYTTGYSTTTDVAGRFRITGMAPGSYLMGARKDGFGSSTPDPGFFSNSELADRYHAGLLHVASGGAPVKVELRLTPTGTLSGRVLAPDGKPARGVEVGVWELLMAEEPVTDEEGRFALTDMRPGSYTLVARPPRSAQPEQASDGTRTAMVITYYPSVADLSLAQQIVFRGAGDLGDYEIRMQTAPVHRVRGIVLDEEGKPSPEAELQLIRIPDGSPRTMALESRMVGSTLFALGMQARFSNDEAAVVSGKDGRFEFPAVPFGDWTIEAEAAEDPKPNFSRGTSDAIVVGADVDDLQLQLKVPFRLVPIIEWKEPRNQRASGPRRAPVILVSADGNELVDMEFGPMYVLPGRYKAVIKPGFSAQIFLDKDEVTGQPFPLTADGPRLRVVPKARSGTVRGTVEKGDGATVVLVPQRVEGVALGQTVVCGADGSFELTEVSPGDYYIAGFDRMDRRLPSAMLLGFVTLRGTSVKVQEGSVANVTLSLISVPQ